MVYIWIVIVGVLGMVLSFSIDKIVDAMKKQADAAVERNRIEKWRLQLISLDLENKGVSRSDIRKSFPDLVKD